jgi:HEAT repeat protein
VLRAAGLTLDGPSLLEFFRARARMESEGDRLLLLTQQLHDPAPDVQARARAALIARGATAIPALRYAVNNLDDPVIADQARRCLQAIEGPGGAAVAAAAARLLAVRKPAGAAEVLLAYLPFADDQTVAEAVTHALTAVAFPDGKVAPAVLHALADPVPVRRAAAVDALCRPDHPEQMAAVRKLLQDPKPAVRLHAALALARQQDATAFPVLIDLLAELSPAQRQDAEDVLEQLAGEWSPKLTLSGEDDVSRRIRRDAWAAWWRNTDGPALLAEFHKRTLSPADLHKFESLIEKLADNRFTQREAAVADLVAYGSRAVPLLRAAARGKDPERAHRSDRCLQLIAQRGDDSLPPAAPRLLALRKPPGAAEALLAYIPWAEGDLLIQELRQALAALALRAGKPDPALIQALEDPLPPRRIAAAEALARAGGLDARPAVRQLLRDPDPGVRVQVALALAKAHEREAVPVLIGSIPQAPADDRTQALDALALLAGAKTPDVPFGEDDTAHRKWQEAWTAWWQGPGASVSLERLDAQKSFLGYTLLVQIQANGTGRVLELTREGRPRWEIENLQFPVDAHILGDNRVLITEYNGMKVTERDFKGNILWQKQGLHSQPVNAQRLLNGHTFIATMNELLEVDRDGREVFRHNLPGQNIVAACKGRNGEMACLTAQGQCVRLDAHGKEIKSFPSGRDGGWTSGIDLLPNGHFLIAQPNRGSVTEVTPDGKTVWQASAPGVTSATGLPNGHILVASHPSQHVVELDRTGRTVWEHKDNNHTFRARRR